jgi:hypothetical protein
LSGPLSCWSERALRLAIPTRARAGRRGADAWAIAPRATGRWLAFRDYIERTASYKAGERGVAPAFGNLPDRKFEFAVETV